MSRPTNLHLVSRVILRRFCDPRNLMTRCSVDYMSLKTVGPDGMARSSRLHPVDPGLFESRWKAVEDSMPHVLEAIDRGTILADAALLDVLRECLAIHLARSNVLLRVHDLATSGFRERMLPRVAQDRRIVEGFRREHLGLVP